MLELKNVRGHTLITLHPLLLRPYWSSRQRKQSLQSNHFRWHWEGICACL